MTTHTRLVTVLVFVCLFVPMRAGAQERSGFWFGVGGGYGSAGVSCDTCGDLDREGSGAAYLKGGWTLNRQTLVGLEFNIWRNSDTSDPDFNASINLYNVSGTLTFYPSATGGMFLKGGLGTSFIDVDVKGAGRSSTLDLGKGFGFILGAGYDIPVARHLAITPALNYWYGSPGDLTLLGATFERNWKQNVVDLTIGITIP